MREKRESEGGLALPINECYQAMTIFNCVIWIVKSTDIDFATVLSRTFFLSYYTFVVAVIYSHNPAFVMHYLLVLKGDIFRVPFVF